MASHVWFLTEMTFLALFIYSFRFMFSESTEFRRMIFLAFFFYDLFPPLNRLILTIIGITPIILFHFRLKNTCHQLIADGAKSVHLEELFYFLTFFVSPKMIQQLVI